MQKISQGKNLPKGAATQWRSWCMHKNYWEVEFDSSKIKTTFSKLTAPIKSLTFIDDNIISKKANQQLLKYYNQAVIHKVEISPYSFGVERIGHFGFFSKKSNVLWQKVL